MRAAVYVRISRDTEGDALGVARQERDCQELAKRLGWEVVSVFNDNDLSAFSGKRRPGYDALLEGVRTGDFGAIVAWHPDRLHRSPRELEGFIDLIESTRVRIATVQTGEYDLTTTAGRMIARVVGAMARGESEHKSDRLRRKHRELAEAGKLSGGGTRPFGFESDRLTILESEAALIREAADRFLAGESVRSIAVDWNTRGVLSVTSRQWSIVTLSTVLRSARIAGLRDHGSTGIVVAEWPAIITPEQHHRLVAIFNSPSRKAAPRPRSYLLSGLVRCSRCGARLIARPRMKVRTYVCAKGPGFNGCGGLTVVAEPLETLIVDALMIRLSSPELRRKIRRRTQKASDTSAPLADLAGIESQLRELAEMWAAGDIDRMSWSTAREALEARRREIGDHLALSVDDTRIAGSVGKPTDVAAEWRSMNLTRRAALLGSVIDHITIAPAIRGRNTFDADRVDVAWRA